MAMTLRMDDKLVAALQQRAKEEGRSVNSLLVKAAEEYLQRVARAQKIDALGEKHAQKWGTLLERLADK